MGKHVGESDNNLFIEKNKKNDSGGGLGLPDGPTKVWVCSKSNMFISTSDSWVGRMSYLAAEQDRERGLNVPVEPCHLGKSHARDVWFRILQVVCGTKYAHGPTLQSQCGRKFLLPFGCHYRVRCSMWSKPGDESSSKNTKECGGGSGKDGHYLEDTASVEFATRCGGEASPLGVKAAKKEYHPRKKKKGHGSR